MADSKRLRILKALTALIEEVTVANGFQHDLPGAVFRGRRLFTSNDPLPMVSILEYLRPDLVETGAGYSRNKNQEDFDLLIQGWAEDDPKNPTDPAHNLLADVKKKVAEIRDETSSNYRLGGLTVDLRQDGGVVRPPEETSAKASFYFRVTLTFVEDVGNPYA